MLTQSFFKVLVLFLAFILICRLELYAQYPGQQIIWDSLTAIEQSDDLTSQQKLEHCNELKSILERYNQTHDSVYARILLSIGSYEVKENKNYEVAIRNTIASIRINTAASRASKYFATKGYFRLAYYYDELGINNKALVYYDSVIALAKTFPDTTKYMLLAKFNKVFIHFRNGDYQRVIVESIDGMHYSLQKKNAAIFIAFLNQKAQSLYFENKLVQAIKDADTAIAMAKGEDDLYELASALKLKAMILKKTGNFSQADRLFNQAIQIRSKTNDYQQISLDFIDYGNFLLESLRNYQAAKKKYSKAIEYSKKINDSTSIALAMTNMSAVFLNQHLYEDANIYCIKAFSFLNIDVGSNIKKNPTADNLIKINSKFLNYVIMINKVEIMLGLYSKTKNLDIMAGCLQTCFVMDTFLTKIRTTLYDTESKLYWRKYTHDFYSDALQACYLSKKVDLAFYFMEKSRAVLLNDKLNELNALSLLSQTDAAKQERFEIRIVGLEQKLAVLLDTSKKYESVQLELSEAKSTLQEFVASLEQKYPAYYQYKNEDKMPSLKNLQQNLAKNKQSFVHYFLGDTVTYILAITPNDTKFVRLSEKEFGKRQLVDFLQFCANKQTLNNHYTSFARLSNSIYKSLFQRLQLPDGRITICTDNIVIPFDALCTDETGKHFLLNNYNFSYVYSARFLMTQFKNTMAKGNFAGFAPVSFNKSLGVVDLKDAANALQASASYYKRDKLFTHQSASRNNFFYYAPSYSIVSIFSHAFADTTDNEPVLFMQDSSIHLSELQLLKQPSTKLVLLSACQTNVGKAATGEGIYSLARGFAAAGIPSVAATLWKADEQTIYAVSEKFNEYLSEGMNKDEALQKAKLYFIKNNNSEKMLPYYWANMILIGNTDAISLATTHNNYWWWWIVVSCLFIAVTVIIRKKNFLNTRK